ncbi:helix-turn-helix domain-containing protein [Rhodanobacter geophilus]|uniref:Helix-turn-helix domain-containing protein n=1 Tax=Rhodanobacter geophilus TaxID=3162488 RepID=A0ABV3QQ35_9GAMM
MSSVGCWAQVEMLASGALAGRIDHKMYLTIDKLSILYILGNTIRDGYMPPADAHPHAAPALGSVMLGAALRARRKALGISMAAAAEAAQVSRITWHRLEKGEATVALGSLLAAARVLGMDLRLQAKDASSPVAEYPLDVGLPLHIRLDDYPQLRSLAWQVGDATQAVSPREALGLYQRNWRHLQPELLEPEERALIDALREVYGADDLRV